MKRRQFIKLLGGTAAWPIAARAQERLPTPTIGWLDAIDPHSGPTEGLTGFNQGLAEQGYVVGRNVNLLFSSAEGDADRMRVLAADLVRRQVAVIVARSGTAAHAAKAATQSIPIVFVAAGDPVEEGLVTSLNRPGGNLTGVAIQGAEIAAKRLELLHELVPKAQSIAAVTRSLGGAGGPDFSRAQARGFQAAALAHGVHLLLFNAVTESDIAGAIANAVQQGAGALLVGYDRSLGTVQAQMISLANHYSLPTMFFTSDAVAAGALSSYGDDPLDRNRQVGLYTGRILKGEKPADLPVRTPTKFELWINLKTGKAIGLDVSQDMLSIADKVIE
jgi:putative ABC transport system substrate-binding protein